MFSCVSGDKHIEIKTPTHQISTKSHEAHEKKKSDDKMFFSQGNKDRRGLLGWCLGGGWDY